MSDLFLSRAVEAARAAGQKQRAALGSEMAVDDLSDHDVKLRLDRECQELITEMLLTTFPDHTVFGEEGGSAYGASEYQWIVDPIDGTVNFFHNFPHFCAAIALQKGGRTIAAVTYDPNRDECFTAEKGKGAFVNDKRLRVAARRDLGEAVLATGIPFMGRPGHGVFLKELHQIAQKVSGVRRFGSAALDLAYVAAGRFDGYWERGLGKWDMAAGLLLVTEAGGMVSDADGGENPLEAGTILAANLDLHPLVLARLKAAV